MSQVCTKCSRANPADAVYCYYDGMVLAGHPGRGGPVAIGAQPFPNPLVFPSGRVCRNFNELALACVDDWSSARDLMSQGYLETFLGGVGRIDLAMAAKASSKFPDADRGLDDLLAKLPVDVLPTPKLSLETAEINLGLLSKDAERRFTLKLENTGSRLLYGTITAANTPWLTFGDQPGVTSKNFSFSHDLTLPVKVVGDRLRASHKPVETKLLIESSGGTKTIVVRADIPVKPFPAGPLGGAKSPRQVAEKAKSAAKDAALLFERGMVRDWYKDNGWTYPVKGPDASGLAAVQQFFEALGLTPAPKVTVSQTAITLAGEVGDKLTHQIEVKTAEKKAVHAYGESDQPWVEVGAAKLNGRTATVPLTIPSVPNRPGETLTGHLTVFGNGNQRFNIPITLKIGGAASFDFAAPLPVVEPVLAPVMMTPAPADLQAPMVVPVTTGPLMPVTTAPLMPMSPVSDFTTEPIFTPRRNRGGDSMFKHLVPAGLLCLAVLAVVIVDLVRGPTKANDDRKEPDPPDKRVMAGTADPATWDFKAFVKKPEPVLGLSMNDEERIGLVLLNEINPEDGKKKRLTYWENGQSSNTIVRVGDKRVDGSFVGYEYYFGRVKPGAWDKEGGKTLKRYMVAPGRVGYLSRMAFGDSDIHVTQYTEIVPGGGGALDTCLVYYKIKNEGTLPREMVGLRVMFDTYIGANDGVPFTIPGEQGFLTTFKVFDQKSIPEYLEVVEKPNDPKNPGTVARMGLKNIRLPGMEIEDIEKLQICRWPGTANQQWDVPLASIAGAPGQSPDSCIVLFWATRKMQPQEERHLAFTYGLGQLTVSPTAGAGGMSMALSVPKTMAPGKESIVVGYVYGGRAGQNVTIELPDGITLAEGDKTKQLRQGGGRDKVEWKIKATNAGEKKKVRITSEGAGVEDTIDVKQGSIFG